MPQMRKLDMAIQVVDWEHRYATGKLQGVEWVFKRLREIMAGNKQAVLKRWHALFEIGE